MLIESRKTEHPGFVETPTRRTRSSRKSTEPTHKHLNGSNTGHSVNGNAVEGADSEDAAVSDEQLNGNASKRRNDPKRSKKVDPDPEYEFGGPWGVGAIMIGFPLLMYYMWIGATFYDGHFPMPARNEGFLHFLLTQGNLVYVGAFPTLKAWTIYWSFFVLEGLFYIYLPGITVMGKPLPHEGGKRLEYYCSGCWSFYVSILLALTLHATGLFKLYTIIDEFGPIMSVAIISGVLVSVIAYVSARLRGVQHRMTGNLVYDFFMGAELNPRMFGILDFKMFFEVRLPWFILFFISLGTAARQYEQFGYVSGEVILLLMAHFLYANACGKAEEAIPTTW